MFLQATADSDSFDLSQGLRKYLTLMSASVSKAAGITSVESNVNTVQIDPQFKKIDLSSKSGEESLDALDLQSKYMDSDLGEKNLMWSLRGSSSEETLRKNLETEVSDPNPPITFSRRLTDIASGWVARMINAAYGTDVAEGLSMRQFQNLHPPVRNEAHMSTIYAAKN